MTTSAEDVIARLRDRADRPNNASLDLRDEFMVILRSDARAIATLIASQAAEIERLTACIAEYIVQIDAQAAEIERLRAHIERGHEIHERLTNFSSHSMEWDMALDEAIAYLSPHAKSKAIDAIEP